MSWPSGIATTATAASFLFSEEEFSIRSEEHGGNEPFFSVPGSSPPANLHRVSVYINNDLGSYYYPDIVIILIYNLISIRLVLAKSEADLISNKKIDFLFQLSPIARSNRFFYSDLLKYPSTYA